MSREEGEGSTSKAAKHNSKSTETHETSERQPQEESPTLQPQSVASTPQRLDDDKKKQRAKRDQLSDSTTPSTPEDRQARPRQVIAVSASKGPAAFFNLSRKFLVTDDSCDLSALEGAIVTAVDAANLLERSQLAKIVSIQTSYVTVESRRKPVPSSTQDATSSPEMTASPGGGGAPSHGGSAQPPSPDVMLPPSAAGRTDASGRRGSGASRDLRRARIVITVQRTDAYRQWLEENPLQAIIAGDGGDDDLPDGTTPEVVPSASGQAASESKGIGASSGK